MKAARLCTVLSLLVLLVFTGCSPEDTDQADLPPCTSFTSNTGEEIAVELVDYAELTIDEHSVTSTKLWYYIYNRSKKDMVYDLTYQVLQYADGAWRELPGEAYDESLSVQTYREMTDETPRSSMADYGVIYGELEPGAYLLIKRVCFASEDPYSGYIAAEFTVPDPQREGRSYPPTCTSYISNAGNEVNVSLVDYAGLAIDTNSINSIGLVCYVFNRSQENIFFGRSYAVVQYVDGAWREVPDLPDVNGRFFSDGITQFPGEKPFEQYAGWDFFYGEVKPGNYLLLKSICYDFERPGDGYIAAQFTIPE